MATATATSLSRLEEVLGDEASALLEHRCTTIPRENLQAIEKALKVGGNKDYTVKLLPSLNHLFQTCTTGAPSEYGKIEETIAPAALQAIGDWIVKHTTGRAESSK